MTKKQTIVITLFLCLFLSGTIISSASAKDFNIPDGAQIIYYSAGECYVTIPMNMLSPGTPRLFSNGAVLPASAIPTETTIQISMTCTIDGSNGPGRSIGISSPFSYPAPIGLVYLPNAYFAAVPDEAITFIKGLLAGYPSAIAKPTYPDDNVKKVDSLSVERHGNSITAQLPESQTFIYAFQYVTSTGAKVNAIVPVTIPSFTIELNKVGGDVQRESTVLLKSGWTQDVNKIGFAAEGTITFNEEDPIALTNCFITMHGITMWTPPST